MCTTAKLGVVLLLFAARPSPAAAATIVQTAALDGGTFAQFDPGHADPLDRVEIVIAGDLLFAIGTNLAGPVPRTGTYAGVLTVDVLGPAGQPLDRFTPLLNGTYATATTTVAIVHHVGAGRILGLPGADLSGFVGAGRLSLATALAAALTSPAGLTQALVPGSVVLPGPATVTYTFGPAAPTPAPAPASAVLLALGLAGVGMVGRWRRGRG